MPDISTVDSWPAALVAALVVICVQVPNLVATIRARRDTRVIREHTENEHAGHPTPNLREQLDAADIRQERIAQDLAALTVDLARHIEGESAWREEVERDLRELSLPWWRRRR